MCQVRQLRACSEPLPITLLHHAEPAASSALPLLRLLLAGGGGVCALLPRRPGGRARRLGRSCCWAALAGNDLAPQRASLPAGETRKAEVAAAQASAAGVAAAGGFPAVVPALLEFAPRAVGGLNRCCWTAAYCMCACAAMQPTIQLVTTGAWRRTLACWVGRMPAWPTALPRKQLLWTAPFVRVRLLGAYLLGSSTCLLYHSGKPHAGQPVCGPAVPKDQCHSAPLHCHPAVQKEAAAAVEVPAGVPSSHWWFG